MEKRLHLGELLSACIDASQRAATIIVRTWKSGKLDVRQKGVDDPFTKADVEAQVVVRSPSLILLQQLIVGLLARKWPELAIVGEETCEPVEVQEQPRLDLVDLQKVPQEYCSVLLQDVCVFVDPLDATREYTEGLLEAVTSLIGISVR